MLVGCVPLGPEQDIRKWPPPFARPFATHPQQKPILYPIRGWLLPVTCGISWNPLLGSSKNEDFYPFQ